MIVRELDSEQLAAFVARGHRARHFFPHRVVRLAKGGPDGLKLARRMCRPDVQPSQLVELLLYARDSALDGLPPEVFDDDEIAWHEQQFGLPGHVATASVVDDGDALYVTTLVSDLVQRIGRRRELKTRVEKRFKGWAHLLLNAVLDLALDRGADRVLIASADSAHRHTDPARTVQRSLFDRVYELTLRPPFQPVRRGDWSVLDVRRHAGIVVRPQVRTAPVPVDRRTICVAHDIEGGWGHLDRPEVAGRMDGEAPAHLDAMLEIEAHAGVDATYCVLGILVPTLAERVRAAGHHCVAFHSFDHAGADEPGVEAQLGRCREVDYRLKGYRPAQSRLTSELSAGNLVFHNFEWLASSRHSLGSDRAKLADGVVWIPISIDDFALHQGTRYEEWLDDTLATLAQCQTAVLSLHDCYGSLWLPRYRDLLSRLAELGEFATLDQLAARVLLRNSL